MDILFVEGWDTVIQSAVVYLRKTRPGHNYKILLKREYSENNKTLTRNMEKLGISCITGKGNGYEVPYLEGIKQLTSGEVDILFSGADIPHFTFLPLLFRGLGVHRKTDLLTSFAFIEGTIERKERRILMLDPTVVTEPTEQELCRMSIRVIKLAAILLGKEPTTVLISHATGRDRADRITKQSRVIQILKSNGLSNILPEPLQLDTALFHSVAEKKIGRMSTLPNVFVLPDISAANILYKSIEHFGGNSIKISSPILWRSPIGEVGLLPRTTTKDQIFHTFDILVKLARINRN